MNRLAFRLLYRDARSGELRLLALALIVAVAAMSAVGFFNDRVRQALALETSQLLGGDLVLTGDQPLPDAFARAAMAQGLRLARSVSFPSMILATGGFRLVDVKAVDGAYPLRGQLRISAQPEGAGEPAGGGPPVGQVWIEPRLGAELRLAPGAELTLGERRFRVAAYLNFEPDRGLDFLGVAPRLMLNLADLESTGLLQNGARVRYRLLLAGEARAVAQFAAWVKPRLLRGQKLEEGARQEVRTALERARRFLGLASLLTVMLAATAMAMAVQRYLERHLDGSAVLRCLGASSGQVLRLYLIQFLGLGLIATLVGVLLGFAAHYGFHALLAGLMTTALPPPGLMPALQGLGVGLALLFGFALPPLLRLRRVAPLCVMRRDLGLPSISWFAAHGVGGAVFVGLIFWLADDPRLGLGVLLAFGLALPVFLLVARGLVWGAARLARWGRSSRLGWRHGVVNIGRQPWTASLQIVALALGGMALLILGVMRGELLAAWERSLPPDLPNRFILNIQPEQRPALAQALRAAGWQADLAPMVRGRLVRIGTRAVSPADYPGDERAQRLVEREFNLSWRADLPVGNRIVAGRWFTAAAGEAVASVESGLAKTLGIHLGDMLEFDIGGQPVQVRVTSLRQLEWDSMRINFFVLMAPGVIDHMPASYLANFHLPAGEAAKLGRIVADFPNLTVIDVDAVLAQLKAVLEQLSGIVQLVFWFTLAAGLLVLHGAMLALLDSRRHSLAIMRALGASRAQLQAVSFGELAAIGALAGLLAALGALLAGQMLAWWLFERVLVPALWLIPAAMFLGVLLTMLAAGFSLTKLTSLRTLALMRAAGA